MSKNHKLLPIGYLSYQKKVEFIKFENRTNLNRQPALHHNQHMVTHHHTKGRKPSKNSKQIKIELNGIYNYDEEYLFEN